MRSNQRGNGIFGSRKDTDLVARIDDEVRAAEEPCHGARMGVVEPLLDHGYTITAPVDLNELCQLALRRGGILVQPAVRR
jgi:hypothetical protein